MSYNPAIAYAGPDPATRSLTQELTARFGKPARTYEFVTGWKSPGNISGHNPDSNGITHGVDIFLTDAQNRWTADHLAARGKNGDRRVMYVIYAGQIASPSTGWAFAGSGWEHWDHPHLSVWDGYWGSWCSLPATVYNDASSWGIAPLAGQTTTITPIKEDTLSAAEVKQIKDHINAVLIGGYQWEGKSHPGIGMVVEENQRRIGAIPAKVWATPVARGGGKVSALQELADTKTIGQQLKAENAALRSVIDQLAKGQGVTIDYARIDSTIQESVKSALADGIDITGEIIVGGAK